MRRTRPASRSVWRESLVVPLTSAVHRVPGTGTRAWAVWALEPPNRSRHSGGTVSVGHQVLEDAGGVPARRGRQPARPAGRVEEPLD